MRYLKEKYKTREGAAKRLAFELAIHNSELARGDVATRCVFGIEQQPDGVWRIAKSKAAVIGRTPRFLSTP